MKIGTGDEKDDNVTNPDSMDRGAAEEKYDDDEKNYAEKEAECPVITPPVNMEEGFGKKN